MKRPSPPGYFAHPSAFVDETASIGNGTRIWHYSHVMAGAKLGENCILGQSVHVGRDVVIGNQVKLQNHVNVYEGVVLEDGVFCGPSMTFTNVINPRARIDRKHEFRRTLVREGVTFGASSTILCGIEVGRFAFVGAGAVVTRTVPAHALVVGCPARVVGWVCECGVKLEPRGDHAACPECGHRYPDPHFLQLPTR